MGSPTLDKNQAVAAGSVGTLPEHYDVDRRHRRGLHRWLRAMLVEEPPAAYMRSPWHRHGLGTYAVLRPDGSWLYLQAHVCAEPADEDTEVAP